MMAKQKDKSETIENVPEIKPEVKKSGFIKKLSKILVTLFTWMIMLVTVLIILQLPQVREYYVGSMLNNERAEIVKLSKELSSLRDDLAENSINNTTIATLNQNIKDVSDKHKILEENNLNTIRSKADNAIVLGIVGRLDNVENKVDAVAKVSDKGALIALAAGLVREAWEKGGDFTYELSVLDALTENEVRIRPEVETLNKYAKTKLYSEAVLVGDFEAIYQTDFSPNEEVVDSTDWKAKFNKKFGKIMTIKYKKTSGQEVEEINLDQVFYLVKNNELNKAVEELKQTKYADLIKSSKALQEWLNYAQARREFAMALSRISAYSLAVMKVNNFNK